MPQHRERYEITSQFHLAYKSEQLVSRSENILYCYFNRQMECVVSRNKKNKVSRKCNLQKRVMGLPFVISYDKYAGNIKYVKISLKTKV